MKSGETNIWAAVKGRWSLYFLGVFMATHNKMGQRRDDISLLDRICTIIQARMKAIREIDDPMETLDLSY